MKKMLWGGRFDRDPAEAAIDFNSGENVQLDAELIPYDIIGDLAHVKMLASRKIISRDEAEAIRSALKGVYSSWQKGGFRLDKSLEDVHMNIEAAVTKATSSGKKMHTARSRNDQVLLDMRLYMRDQTLIVISALDSLMDSLEALSKKDGPMAAYTHTRVAQPITVSFWCDGWIRSLERDEKRLSEAYRRVNQNPLGACAIAGTPWPIDRQETAKLMAFDGIQENELDTISSRGECEAELLSALSLVMCKLSRLSEELIWLSQKGMISISEEHTTGSSIMPNKKNPDVLELVRGRCSRVYGDLVHCLACLKGLISGYHSDMQETKFAMMQGFKTSKSSIEAMAMVLRGVEFVNDEIRAELESGFAQATAVADHLAMNGMPFREAHERSGKLVNYCEKGGITISELDNVRAGTLLGVTLRAAEWRAISSLERPRLKRVIRRAHPSFVREEKERISKAFEDLLL